MVYIENIRLSKMKRMIQRSQFIAYGIACLIDNFAQPGPAEITVVSDMRFRFLQRLFCRHAFLNAIIVFRGVNLKGVRVSFFIEYCHICNVIAVSRAIQKEGVIPGKLLGTGTVCSEISFRRAGIKGC